MISEKINFYRKPAVVSKYKRIRFGGETGAWIDQHEREVVTDLLNGTSGKLLDLACGQGRLSHGLSLAGWNIIGLDASLGMLMESEGSRVQGDAFHLPFVDNSFQGVVSLRFFFHLEDPEPVLKEICRVVAKDGAIVVDFGYWTLRGLIPAPIASLGGRIFHHRPETIKILADSLGMEFCLQEPIFFIPPAILKFLSKRLAKKVEELFRQIGFPPSRYAILLRKR